MSAALSYHAKGVLHPGPGFFNHGPVELRKGERLLSLSGRKEFGCLPTLSSSGNKGWKICRKGFVCRSKVLFSSIEAKSRKSDSTAELCRIEQYFAGKMPPSSCDPYSGVSHFMQQEFLGLFIIAVTAFQIQVPGSNEV